MDLERQHGAAAVEFAIILPFLVLLVYGTIEFGLLLYNQQVLTNASREGARAAIVGKCADRLSNSAISQIVNKYCTYTDTTGQTVKRLITFNAANNPPSVSVVPGSRGCGSGVGAGQDITVSVTYVYDFLAPDILGLGLKKTLTARTAMKMESNE